MTQGLPIRAVGFCWYRREEYDRLRKLMVDGRKLPRTFDDWLSKATKGVEHFEKQGAVAVKVYLDPVTFPAWCIDRGLNLDANARMQFANEGAMEAHGRTH